MMLRRRTQRGRGRWLAAATALACGLAGPASAEVRVEGNLAALRVSSGGEALSDILKALGESFQVRTRSSVPLNAGVSGAYAGSLSQVMSRLLDSYNYVIKQDQGVAEIIVFGKKGEAVVAPKPAAAKGGLARWR